MESKAYLEFLNEPVFGTRSFPLDWRTSAVNPTYRSRDKFDPDDHRPISFGEDFLQKHSRVDLPQGSLFPSTSVDNYPPRKQGMNYNSYLAF